MRAVPPRARLKSIHWAGRYTWLLAGLTVIAAGVLMKIGLYTALPGYLSVLLTFGLMVPIWIGVRLDRNARIQSMLGHFADQGFIKCQVNELEEELLHALEMMKPIDFPAERIRFASRGLVDDREVVLLELFFEDGNSNLTYTGCAAWIPFALPKTLIRRRSLKDRFCKQEIIGDPSFDKQRVIQSENHDAISPLLCPLSAWFVTDKSQISSFRMGQPPGKVEQWFFNEHWIILVDQGSAYVKQHLSMAEFLSAFVIELEAQFYSKHDRNDAPENY
jgi:hypothetical protein